MPMTKPLKALAVVILALVCLATGFQVAIYQIHHKRAVYGPYTPTWWQGYDTGWSDANCGVNSTCEEGQI